MRAPIAAALLLCLASCGSSGTADAAVSDAVALDARSSDGSMMPRASSKPIIYQLFVRHFGNVNETRRTDGTLAENGSGKFADVNDAALRSLRAMGFTHVWLTGVLRQATLTDYSQFGMPADDADIVKGRAGSPYAIRDYYDVSPDYAVSVPDRMQEFEALVARCHAADLKVLIDLVPNHVARSYASVVRPETDFGRDDDRTVFFSPRNDFFYLADPPGRALELRRPASWSPSGVIFNGRFGPEDGQSGRTPRATGNDVTSVTPSDTDWYETIKLNYGRNFTNGQTAYDPPPSVWGKVDAILAYWQAKGVDGFRADFAHFVPSEAWVYLTTRARQRDPDVFLMAEAYADLELLLRSGFDAVYWDEIYDTLKRLYQGRASQSDIDGRLGSLDDSRRPNYLVYLENHDERRIASPVTQDANQDASGFGSPSAGRQLAPLLYLHSRAPVLFYNGQEVGETGAGAEGFGQEDGKTSIFDYGSMPAFVPWVGPNHTYDGAALTAEQRALREYYGDLLALTQDPAVLADGYWGLKYWNAPARFSDCPEALFSYARYVRGSGRALIVVANFAPGVATTGKLRIPAELAQAAGIDVATRYRVRLILDPAGARDQAITTADRDSLVGAGFEVTVADQAANVYVIEPAN